MPKFEIKATELTDTDVNFVALVKRGANRIPFRLTKGETDMIDLHKIGRQMFKKADPAPVVVAIVTQKSDLDPKLISTVAKAAGLDKLAKSDKDGIVSFSKADAPTEGLFLVKLDEDIALAVAHSQLRKGFSGYDFSSTDFKDVVGTNGFCSGLCLASNALDCTIGNILANAESPAAAREQIDKAIDDFKAYVGALTGGIPVQAFKADQALALAKAEKNMDGDGKASGGTDDDQSTGDEDDKTKAKKADAGKNGTGAGFEGGAGSETNDRATSDDKENTEVNAKPGEKVSGAKKGENGFTADSDRDGDDDTIMTGESQAGEGAAQPPTDSQAATARATADDKKTPKTQGQPGGATLDTAGIPDKALAKNEGDADVGQKDKGNKLPDRQSGAGAQEKDVQTLKSDDPVMLAIQALAKSVQESVASVSKRVDELGSQVQGVAALAKKTDAALNGTVFNETDGDAPARIEKSEGRSGDIPLLDTAYSRRSNAA